jgi:hypothetical protein
VAGFDISLVTVIVALDPERTGTASFTVQNETGHRVRARATPVGLAPTESGWLSVVGEAERDYDVAAIEQVSVAISVPMTAPAGDYLFRLDVVSLDRPDEEFQRSAAVTCQVPEPPPPPPPPPERPGYIETLGSAEVGGLGCLLAAIAIGALLFFVFGVVLSGLDFFEALGNLILLLILSVLMAAAGLWIGAAAGAFLGLRAFGFEKPSQTALVLAILLPFWGFLVVIVGAAINDALDPPSFVTFLLIIVLAALIVAVPALVGRAIARWRQTGHL